MARSTKNARRAATFVLEWEVWGGLGVGFRDYGADVQKLMGLFRGFRVPRAPIEHRYSYCPSGGHIHMYIYIYICT